MFKIFKAKTDEKFNEIGMINNIASYSYGGSYDDFERDLKGSKKFETYEEMSINDATISGILYVIKSLICKTDYKIEAGIEDRQGFDDAVFVEQCFEDMSFTFSDLIDEVLSMLENGFSLFEIVYKIRKGQEQKDSKFKSKFNDNYIGWKKFGFRSQDTILVWDIDSNGGINGATQVTATGEVYIPIDKLLLFRTSTKKNNPEGKSFLRGCYKAWKYKKHIEKFEAIGIERDLAGLPIARIPKQVMKDSVQFNEWKKVVSNIKVDEQNGIVIPSDLQDGNRLYDIELLTASGAKSFDTDKIITRYDQRIAMSLSSDFMLLGQGSSGSWALSTDKTEIFQTSLNAITKKIEEVINRYAIPRLFEVNGFRREEYPKLKFGSVAKRDLTQMANLISSLSAAGMPIFPNSQIENTILNMLGFESLGISVESKEVAPVNE